MAFTDEDGLERIFRLFPLRTGIMIPEWIVTGPKADLLGAGGLLGAGYWGRSWEWNENISWLGFN
ncbi:5679_t:CDS:2 [Acaulospora colombiana]|uniref:5679_t:CDS:1 n=1 Tax=Acaulospora colombiana TaxID=27376 RepID=A0ACA9PR57_9GLOM|nr:5679_t:CDS:2 [Acaulospora colombiana]